MKIISCRLNIRSRSLKCHMRSAKLRHWSVLKKEKKKKTAAHSLRRLSLPQTVTWPGLLSSSSNQKCTGNRGSWSSASRRSRLCQHACTWTQHDEVRRVFRDELEVSAPPWCPAPSAASGSSVYVPLILASQCMWMYKRLFLSVSSCVRLGFSQMWRKLGRTEAPEVCSSSSSDAFSSVLTSPHPTASKILI